MREFVHVGGRSLSHVSTERRMRESVFAVQVLVHTWMMFFSMWMLCFLVVKSFSVTLPGFCALLKWAVIRTASQFIVFYLFFFVLLTIGGDEDISSFRRSSAARSRFSCLFRMRSWQLARVDIHARQGHFTHQPVLVRACHGKGLFEGRV